MTMDYYFKIYLLISQYITLLTISVEIDDGLQRNDERIVSRKNFGIQKTKQRCK